MPPIESAPEPAEAPANPIDLPRVGRRKAPLKRTRARVISGLVLIVPFAVTIFVARFLYRTISDLAAPATSRILRTPFLEELGEVNPELHSFLEFGSAIVIGAVLLYVLGALSTLFVTRKLYDAGESLMLRIPLLREVYGLTKQVLGMIANKKQAAFKQVALVDVAGTGVRLLAFLTGESRADDDPERVLVHALMPFAPIPTQLVLFIIPAERVQVLDLPMEDAMKLLMSGGAVSPSRFRLSPYVAIDARPRDEDELLDEREY